MERKKIKMSKIDWLKVVSEYLFIVFSLLGVVALRLKKYMKWYVFLSKLLLAFFLGIIIYYGVESLGFPELVRCGIVSIGGYFVDQIYDIILVGIKSIPSIVKGKFNLKSDCKIEDKNKKEDE